ncbi:Inositol polyphosphate 5-phosphatase OCRL [Apodemus speciosus]|uniref:Protein ZIP4 homolog n=1 Tax=Apodemus speciosus TaxID=105296 RepID=A0ABQ0FUS0_APOSI
MNFKEIAKTLIITGNSRRLHEMIDRFFINISNFNRESLTEMQNIQIEEMAVNLWNWTVTKRIELSVRKNQAAKLCYIACKLLCMHGISVSSEEAIQRQILMNMKTGKEWLNTGNPQIADEFFQAAMANLEKLYVRLMQSCYTEPNLSMYKITVEKGIFHVLSYQAESSVAQGDFKKSSMCILRCKDMLMRLPEMPWLQNIFIYSVITLELKQASRINTKRVHSGLDQSYEIGKMDNDSVEPQMLAKALRFLATIYLNYENEEYCNKALIAILLANKEHLDPAGLFLKMRILMKGKAWNDELLEAAKEILYLAMPLEFCLSVIQFLMDNKRDSVGFCFLRIISDHFTLSEDRKRIVLFYVEMLLQKDQDMIAEEKIKEILIDHQTRSRLTRDLVNWLHNILWGKAARSVEIQDYADALHWYSYSLKLYECDQADLDLVKLKRNMASCYLPLRQLDKAKEAIAEAEQHDPTNTFTQYCIFKIAIMEGDIYRALQVVCTLKKFLMDEESEDRGLIESGVSTLQILNLSIDFALENGQQFVAEKGLEYLFQLSKDPKEVLGALKKKEMDRLLNYLNTALLKISEHFDESPLDSTANDASWLRKIAWNLALQSEKDLEAMKNFFMVSYELSLFCPVDQGLLIAQKTCLLVAAAVDLEQGRKATTTYEQNKFLRTALEQIQKCKTVWNLLKQTGDFSGDDCGVMLLLYEFEVKTKTNDPSLERFLDSLWKMPGLQSTTLETIALLAMDKPAHYPTIAQKALKKLLVIYRRRKPVDVLKYSTCMHNLIGLLVSDEIWNIAVYPLKEVWNHLKNALNIISQNKGYPEEEIAWLMIKAWNIGILMYSKNKHASSERWAGMAMEFLGHLGSLKTSYEAKVNLLYANLKEALDKKVNLRSTEMTEWLKALTVPPKDQGSVPSTNTAAHNHV